MSSSLRSMSLLTSLLASACTFGGTLDNIPHRSTVEVTGAAPEGPQPKHLDCPSNPPSLLVCVEGTQYICDADPKTGCPICGCKH